MGIDAKKALAVGKKYTRDSLQGVGAIAGKPCQIQSITPIAGGNRVTFLWVDNSGIEHTSILDVQNGAQGQQGEKGETGAMGNGIDSMRVGTDSQGDSHLYVTYTDDPEVEVDLGIIAANVPIATNHSLGKVKGGNGTYIEENGEITVVNRLMQGYVTAPDSYIPFADANKIILNEEDSGIYKKGGIYQLLRTSISPEGTENPSEEGWYEWDSVHREYNLTEDTTVDSEKYYFSFEWILLSANSQEFNTNDFDVVNDVVSLNVSQRTFTGTQADWEALTTEEKKTYGTVNITDDEDGSLEYYSTTETKTNKVWINGKPIYRKVISGDAAFSNTNWTNITISSDGVTKNVTDWKMLMAASSFRPRDFTITDVFSLSTASSEGNGNTVSGIFTLIIEYTKEG